MLWIAMSPKGMSTPVRTVLTSGRSMAVTARSYTDNCLKPHLVPFLNDHYPHGGYIFWPDKASAHYARISTDFLDNNNVRYVKKANNLTKVPRCQPIEDFFRLLVTVSYHKNCKAKDVLALKRWILKCHQQLYKQLWRRYRKGSYEPIESSSWKFVIDNFCFK